MNKPIDFSKFPDARGHFGIHGGRFVSETLMAALTPTLPAPAAGVVATTLGDVVSGAAPVVKLQE